MRAPCSKMENFKTQQSIKLSTGSFGEHSVSVSLRGPHTHRANLTYKWILLKTKVSFYFSKQIKWVHYCFTMWCSLCFYYCDYVKWHCSLCSSFLGGVETSQDRHASFLNVWFPPARWPVWCVRWMQGRPCSFVVRRNWDFSETTFPPQGNEF